MKWVKLLVSRLSSPNSMLLVAIAGFRYCHASWTCLLWPAYCEAEPWKTSWMPLRVGASSVLKSSSRSTAAVVWAVEISPLLGIGGAVAGAEVEVHVPVGDPRQRRLADDRLRALVQRLEGRVVDRQGQLGLTVGGQLDVRDAPDRAARHLHLVAGDDLAGVREDRLDLVARAAREQQDGHGHDDHRDCAQRDDSARSPMSCATRRPSQFGVLPRGQFDSPAEVRKPKLPTASWTCQFRTDTRTTGAGAPVLLPGKPEVRSVDRHERRLMASLSLN